MYANIHADINCITYIYFVYLRNHDLNLESFFCNRLRFYMGQCAPGHEIRKTNVIKTLLRVYI